MGSISIRTATLADLPRVTTLLVAQMRDHDNDLPDAVLSAAALGMLQRPQRGQILLACDGDDAIGFAALSSMWTLERGGRSAWLDELFVVPARRGDGIGAVLLAAAIEAARAAGARALDLEIERGHEQVERLYGRHGFATMARQRMVLELAPPASAVPAAPRLSPAALAGGCLCGAVRYRADAAPRDVCYCHCRMCQRASGAPVVAWATLPAAAFRFERGTPRERRSSAAARRWFCDECGSALAFQFDRRPDEIDVTVATLDAPDAVAPDAHIFTDSRRAWLHLDDELPRHAGTAR